MPAVGLFPGDIHEPSRRLVEHGDCPLLVDCDDTVDQRVQDGLENRSIVAGSVLFFHFCFFTNIFVGLNDHQNWPLVQLGSRRECQRPSGGKLPYNGLVANIAI